MILVQVRQNHQPPCRFFSSWISPNDQARRKWTQHLRRIFTGDKRYSHNPILQKSNRTVWGTIMNKYLNKVSSLSLNTIWYSRLQWKVPYLWRCFAAILHVFFPPYPCLMTESRPLWVMVDDGWCCMTGRYCLKWGLASIKPYLGGWTQGYLLQIIHTDPYSHIQITDAHSPMGDLQDTKMEVRKRSIF